MPGSKIINYVVLAHKWFYDFMTRPDMRVLRAGGTRLAPTATECRTKWGVCLTISEFEAELWGAACQWHAFSTDRSET